MQQMGGTRGRGDGAGIRWQETENVRHKRGDRDRQQEHKEEIAQGENGVRKQR